VSQEEVLVREVLEGIKGSSLIEVGFIQMGRLRNVSFISMKVSRIAVAVKRALPRV
jgi:hypothetical protein